jgi:hypothetical protein
MPAKKNGQPKISERELSAKQLAKLAKEASAAAIAESFSRGLTISIIRDGKLLEIDKDGNVVSERVLDIGAPVPVKQKVLKVKFREDETNGHVFVSKLREVHHSD